MNPSILAVIRCSLMFLVPTVTYAISAQWDLDPISGDWNTAANWTPISVPNGPADVATFGLSNTTDVSISANTEVNGITFTSAATNPYTIIANPGLTLTISGAGIKNNSGTTQSFATAVNPAGSPFFNDLKGRIEFTNAATAGSSTVFINNGATAPNHGPAPGGSAIGGITFFRDASTAGSAIFINNGGTVTDANGSSTFLEDNSTPANGTFINNGGTASGADGGNTIIGSTAGAGNGTFINNGGTISGAGGGLTAIINSTAANGTFINNGGTASGAGGGSTIFFADVGASSAADVTITNNGGTVSGAGGGETIFETLSKGSSTAADSIIINNGATVSGAFGGATVFGVESPGDTSTAGSATLIANSGTNGGRGGTIVFENRSTAGTARIEVFGNGALDISRHNAPGMTINSIGGDGDVFLGANNLTVGSNNLSTTFSCAIQDGGQGGGVGGSLTKIGLGTLILSGANTYTGNTNVDRGVLNVAGSINSNTTVHGRGTLVGTGTINGNVTNRGTVSPGDPVGTLTINNYTQYATLMIQIAGVSPDQFSVLNVLGTANLSGQLDPVLFDGFVPTIGESFTFLNAGAVNGTLFIFNRNIDDEPLHWNVTYFPTYAMLTVAAGNVAIPDQGSTFLLLTLGLLGLVTFRRQLLRCQP
jgi:autotransporter-associated beta strand protein